MNGRQLSRSKTRTADVKDILLGWIREGKYPPGSHLPSVPELVSRFGVSRTVVREALQSLVGMNFVEMRAGLGCFVRSVPPDLIVNADVMAALIDIETLLDVAEARKVIEGAVTRVAVVEALEEDFDQMELVLERIARLSAKNQPMYSVTPDFHVAVAAATHNTVLAGVVSSFNVLMAAAGQIIESDDVGPRYRREEYQSHRDLLDVFRRRDPDAAQRAIEQHIQKTIETLRKVRQFRKRDGGA